VEEESIWEEENRLKKVSVYISIIIIIIIIAEMAVIFHG